MGWWLSLWWQNEVIDGYKGPLLLSFTAFVVTFVASRTVTRLIRAGKGPFHNFSTGGVHMHHSTPGVLLLIAGGFTALGSPPLSAWTYASGVIVGTGAALVLDEFAMIFRLQDVYWSQEGQMSVNMVTLVAACVGLAAVGVSPFNVKGLAGAALAVRLGATLALLCHLILLTITALKGKYPTTLIGLFISPVTWGSPPSDWPDPHRRGRATATRRRSWPAPNNGPKLSIADGAKSANTGTTSSAARQRQPAPRTTRREPRASRPSRPSDNECALPTSPTRGACGETS
jgi:hypothetical protein